MQYLATLGHVGTSADAADELEARWIDMPWTKPSSDSHRQVDLAGEIVSGREPASPEMDMDSALEIAGNWRSSHGYPLHIMAVSLDNRAKKFDKRALVASRLKRLPSIAAKLARFQTMQLSKMVEQ